MKGLKGALSFAMVAVLPALAQPGSTPLPPDIDERSYSRLPLIQKDSLDAEGRRVFEAINGKEGNTPRLGPPASSLYSVAAAEPYDRLNQLLRSANVIGPQFFEISTLVPARESAPTSGPVSAATPRRSGSASSRTSPGRHR